MSIARLAVLTGLAALSAAFSAVNPKLASLPDNTWMILDSTGPLFEGRAAYSGGAYDRANHKFLIFGGGHWDGWHNDVLALDIASMTWQSMYATDSADDHVCGNVDSVRPGMLVSSGLPASRHTYDQIEFMDHLGKMIIWSGPTYSGIWGCPGQTLPADTWLYDWATNRWEYKNVSRTAQPAGESGSGAYDPVGRLYYGIIRDNYFYPVLWAYDDAADQWVMLAKFSDSASGTLMPANGGFAVMDTKRRTFWSWPVCWDIAADKWSKGDTTGAPGWNNFSEGGVGMVYDEANDVMVSFSTDRTLMYIYHIAEDSWESFAPTGTTPPAGRCYGRFFYDPVDSVFLLITQVNYRAQTWAYRYKRAPSKTELARTPKTENLHLFPNPARTMVRVEGAAGRVNLYDIKGSMIMTCGRTLDVSGLANGLYVVRAETGKGSCAAPLLIER